MVWYGMVWLQVGGRVFLLYGRIDCAFCGFGGWVGLGGFFVLSL